MNYIQRRRALEALQNRVKEAFQKSQDSCPVVTGALKRSGSFYLTEDGARILYAADYADIVEEGRKGGNEEVNGHWRNGGWVNGYERRQPERPPNPFITSAVEEAVRLFLTDLRGIV